MVCDNGEPLGEEAVGTYVVEGKASERWHGQEVGQGE